MVHNPKHKVHSFRGLLGDGGEDEIELERQNMNVAFRIVKFEVMPNAPGTATQESIVKIYREEQTSIPTSSGTIDFTETDLLAAAYYVQYGLPAAGQNTAIVTFDNTLFSRNIFVTHTDNDSAVSCNYYIELEEVPVGAATLMQLKLGTARKLIGAKMGG